MADSKDDRGKLNRRNFLKVTSAAATVPGQTARIAKEVLEKQLAEAGGSFTLSKIAFKLFGKMFKGVEGIGGMSDWFYLADTEDGHDEGILETLERLRGKRYHRRPLNLPQAGLFENIDMVKRFCKIDAKISDIYNFENVSHFEKYVTKPDGGYRMVTRDELAQRKRKFMELTGLNESDNVSRLMEVYQKLAKDFFDDFTSNFDNIDFTSIEDIELLKDVKGAVNNLSEVRQGYNNEFSVLSFFEGDYRLNAQAKITEMHEKVTDRIAEIQEKKFKEDEEKRKKEAKEKRNKVTEDLVENKDQREWVSCSVKFTGDPRMKYLPRFGDNFEFSIHSQDLVLYDHVLGQLRGKKYFAFERIMRAHFEKIRHTKSYKDFLLRITAEVKEGFLQEATNYINTRNEAKGLPPVNFKDPWGGDFETRRKECVDYLNNEIPNINLLEEDKADEFEDFGLEVKLQTTNFIFARYLMENPKISLPNLLKFEDTQPQYVKVEKKKQV